MFALVPLICALSESAFGFGQIQASGDVLVFVLELVDGAVERRDLGGALCQADVVGERPDHGRVDKVDDAEVGRIERNGAESV